MKFTQTYADELREIGDEQERLHRLNQEAKALAKLTLSVKPERRVKPLDEQITEFMLTLPPQLRDRPWRMSELVQQLAGRFRERPHAQHVGQALIRLRWTRKRLWTSGANGQRVWLPR